jgi:O-antigen ligase
MALALLFLSLLMLNPSVRKSLVYLAIVLICCVAVFLSMYRTLYVALAASMPILFLLARPSERRQGYRHLLFMGGAAVLLTGVLYSSIRLARVMITAFFMRIDAGVHSSTDLSLLNRYSEWSCLWELWKSSPLTGYGFGAQYWNWNIISYSHVLDGYSHSGYFFILFKSGIVGFLLLFGAYLFFIRKGWKLSRNVTLSPTIRAVLRALTAYLIGMLLVDYALNWMDSKGEFTWIALIWGYFLAVERKIRTQQNAGLDPWIAPPIVDCTLPPVAA